MKKIGFIQPESPEPEKQPENITRQIVSAYIDENYEPYGDVERKEFRTTLELTIEMQEMTDVGMNELNKMLQEKGFKTIFIEGVSNWIMYEKN